MAPSITTGLLLPLLAATSSLAFDTTARCTTSTFSSLSGVEISAVESLKGSSILRLPDLVPSCGGPDKNVTVSADICRLVANVRTSNSSSIRIEAWLPDKWNSRFLATGTGGTGGCVDYSRLQSGAQLGFAAFGTNAGHDGSSGHEFFLNQPEVINDFGHRAIHVEAEVGKQVTALFYGRDASKSYYDGCSTGGRQALQEAAMYEDDFDGILAGAPGVDWLKIVASKAILARRIGWPDLNSSAYVRPEQWQAIAAKQIELFDGLDGEKDGIIDAPQNIPFDPALLACGTGALGQDLCLHPDQVQSVEKAYQPLTNGAGEIIYPPFIIGASTGVFSNNQKDGKPILNYSLVRDFWRGAVYNNSDWTENNFTLSDLDYALSINPGGVNSNSRDLSRFHQRGGKVLAYHGLVDTTVTPLLSMEFYKGVQAAVGLSLEEMQSFYRLFLVPGMDHCSTGPGAWNIGQVYPLDDKRLNAANHALLALVDWVEEGKAPGFLNGAKYQNDSVSQPILAERKHCPYPSQGRWDGRENRRDVRGWVCEYA
ncbi:unnamed protein product [Clonostachys rosea f. rosea IK726]|uniref:Carboxylic ester hydrolase n=2 Tax=Bionectria ochroleuca TaxID=29856 RepID=A0A0B7JUK0_BIOOC|nr:unnamed protein product [Clonostachys rosea f. rosea IK726]